MPVTLRGGSRIRVRQGHRADRRLLLQGRRRLSDESRYRRFLFAMAELSEATVRYLTEIDHHDHKMMLMMIALDLTSHRRGRLSRPLRPRRHSRDPAEFAVTVIDDWQGRGVGTLLEVLNARARQESITTLTALVLAANRDMMEVIRAPAPVRIVDRAAGAVEVEIPIPTRRALPRAERAPAHRGTWVLNKTPEL